MYLPNNLKRQKGAALVIGLILLVVITVLAISGMNTATTELAMARNDQNAENAFQAAETGLENAITQGSFTDVMVLPQYISASGHEYVDARVDFEAASNVVPDRAFSLGSGVQALHFIATSQATSARDPGNASDRDAVARHTQAFYVIGPATNSL
ncbi:MAG: hypothetical protein HKN77_01275 [Woeseiaceae bacterium]|nr:hypothetical protein [Woeseiaceae bacterium]